MGDEIKRCRGLVGLWISDVGSASLTAQKDRRYALSLGALVARGGIFLKQTKKKTPGTLLRCSLLLVVGVRLIKADYHSGTTDSRAPKQKLDADGAMLSDAKMRSLRRDYTFPGRPLLLLSTATLRGERMVKQVLKN